MFYVLIWVQLHIDTHMCKNHKLVHLGLAHCMHIIPQLKNKMK